MTVFERAGDRVLVPLSCGGLAATQTMINVVRQRAAARPPHIWNAGSMFDVANLVADAMRATKRQDAGDSYLEVLTRQWVEGTRRVFQDLPPLQWQPPVTATSRRNT